MAPLPASPRRDKGWPWPQNELGRERDTALCPVEEHSSGLERIPEGLARIATPLQEFIRDQESAVGEREFTGAKLVACQASNQ